MERFRTKLTQRQRSFTGLPVDESAASNPGRTQESRATRKRSLLLATIAAGLALLPLSYYGLVGAQAGSTNSGSVQQTAEEQMIQFNLVPAPDVIANCFPDATAKVRVLLTEEELGTDTFTLSEKHLRPDTSFAVFLTGLPGPPFGAVQYLAGPGTNANGRGLGPVNAIIGEAFISQVIDGQRVPNDLNHVVFWFADPADADACFAPATAGIGSFDADAVSRPAAMSSKSVLPGAPLP